MIDEKRPEICRVNFPYFEISMVLFWQHKHTNTAHALQCPYLFLKSCHSLYNLSRALLVLVRIFSSTESKSFIRETNRWASFTSHDGWNRFRDWNQQIMETEILQTISITGYLLNPLFHKEIEAYGTVIPVYMSVSLKQLLDVLANSHKIQWAYLGILRYVKLTLNSIDMKQPCNKRAEEVPFRVFLKISMIRNT